MKHLEEYNSIIEYRKSNPLPKDVYGENHHIVPRSICPLLKDSKDNIVRLTAQEHFLAHYHLWKAYRDELKEKAWTKKMCFAFRYMKRVIIKCEDMETCSRLYSQVREDFSKIISETNLGRAHSDEACRKISQAKKGMKWWTNGEKNIKSRVCPPGYVSGRTIKYTYDTTKEEAKKYTSRGAFAAMNHSAYNAAYRNQWLDEFFPKSVTHDNF